MTPLLEQHLDAIHALCRKHRVTRLDLFGSAARDDFDPQTSDVDFIAEFEEMEPGDAVRHYCGLIDDLKELLGREVDVLTVLEQKNKYFRAAVNKDRTTLYAA